MINTNIVKATENSTEYTKSRKLYNSIWRWHFYAGFLTIPIVLFLVATGILYLFRPQVEPAIYKSLYNVVPQGTMLTEDEQLAIALATIPESTARAFTPSQAPNESAKVELNTLAGRTYVYVNPYTGEVLGSHIRDQMIFRKIRKLHGELLLKRFGTTIVELTASWMMILLISGLFLWWPRPKFTMWGTFLIRVRKGGRTFWKDFHSVIGVYTSIFAVILLFTGLQWSDVWGGAFSQVRDSTGHSTPPALRGATLNTGATLGAGQVGISLAEVNAIAKGLDLPASYSISMPKKDGYSYGINSSLPNKPSAQKSVHINPVTGEVFRELSWKDRPFLSQIVTVGISLHQGELFGWANFIIAGLTAIGIGLLSISGFIMWWKRRPENVGKLGAPAMPKGVAIPRGITIITIALAIFFPLVGASLIVLWLLEQLILKRIPATRKFFGLAGV